MFYTLLKLYSGFLKSVRKLNRIQIDKAYLAVAAVLGVLIACSIVPGLPDCVPGLTNPLRGRPACETGLQ